VPLASQRTGAEPVTTHSEVSVFAGRKTGKNNRRSFDFAQDDNRFAFVSR
jgi:hypothetical protein